MFNKRLKNIVPKEFRSSIDFYWQFDEKFLKSASSYQGEPPSLACLIADVYARRNGNGFVKAQTKLLFDAYHAYFELVLSPKIPALMAAKEICTKFGAASTLMDIGVNNAEPYIAADILMLRSNLYNYPVILSYDVVSIDKDIVEISDLKHNEFIIRRQDYCIAVSTQSFSPNSCIVDRKTISQYVDSGYIPTKDCNLNVLEFLVFKVGDTDSSGAVFYSTYFNDSVLINEVNNETDQLIKDAALVVDGIRKGILSEAISPASKAWKSYSESKSKAKLKENSKKLYLPRRIVVHV